MSKKKMGRNLKWCKAYKANNKREKNKVLKVLKHLVKFPEDNKAIAFVKKTIILVHMRVPKDKAYLLE